MNLQARECDSDDDLFIPCIRKVKKPRLAKGVLKNKTYTCVICLEEPTIKNHARFFNRACLRAHPLCHGCLMQHQETWLEKRAAAKRSQIPYRHMRLKCPECRVITARSHFEVLPIPDAVLKDDHVLTQIQQAEERKRRWEEKAIKKRGNTECHYCGKNFASSTARSKHVSSVHKGRKFNCGVCKKGYVNKDKLEKHVQRNDCIELIILDN